MSAEARDEAPDTVNDDAAEQAVELLDAPASPVEGSPTLGGAAVDTDVDTDVDTNVEIDVADSDRAEGHLAEDDHAAHGAEGDDAEADADEDGAEDSGADDEEDDDVDSEDSDAEDSDAEDAEASAAGEGAAAGSSPKGRRPLSRERTEHLEREGEIAADFLERLLDIADMDGDIDVDIDGDRAVVAIVDSEDGRVPRRLVGTDGKVLEALQELTRLAVQAETGDRSRLMLDVAGHRATRRRVVIGEAREAIASVRAGAPRVAMHPMTAFERKVVHDEVLAAGLVSESDGAEPGRYVVVYPA